MTAKDKPVHPAADNGWELSRAIIVHLRDCEHVGTNCPLKNLLKGWP